MNEDKLAFLHDVFNQVENQVQFGDSKAALLVAGDTILLAISGGLIKMVSGCQGDSFTPSCIVPSIPLGLAAMAAALLVLSLASALIAARPASVHDQPRHELFLISHIARTSRGDFIKKYKDATLDDLLEEALKTIHGKAAYATGKFRWLKHAIDATLLSLGFLIATPLAAIIPRVL